MISIEYPSLFDHLQSSRLVSLARLSCGGRGVWSNSHVTQQEFLGMLIDLVTIEAHSFLFWHLALVLTKALMSQLC